MSLLVRLQERLDRSGVAYTHTVHPLAYTAREVAAAEHLPAQEVAKVVVFLAWERCLPLAISTACLSIWTAACCPTSRSLSTPGRIGTSCTSAWMTSVRW